MRARGRVVLKVLCYKPKGRGFETRWDLHFVTLPNLSGRIGPGVYSDSNRNEHQKQDSNVSVE
jgi:hypothetical protein